MAGEGGGAPPSSLSSASVGVGGEKEWHVEYSRFFNFPKAASSSTLKVLPLAKSRRGGVWITASSLSSIRIRPHVSSGAPVLSVFIPGVTYEEHFISKLNITWPQVPCTSEDSLEGSRTVIFSFRDFSKQIQKFAARFSECSEVQLFLKHVKENSSDMIDFRDNQLTCGKSSQRTSSKEVSCRHFVGGHEYKEYSGDSFSAPTSIAAAKELSLQAPVVNSCRGVLPPSFDDYLLSCSKMIAEDYSKPTNEDCSLSHNKSSLSDSILNVETPEKRTPAVVVNKELVNFTPDASFHDRLSQLEGIIAVLGDDMSL